MKPYLSILIVMLTLLFNNISIAQVTINELGADPSNLDGLPLNSTGEFIELYNAGGSSVDISGWILADANAALRFPAGSNIAAGQFLLIGSYGLDAAPNGTSNTGISCRTCDFNGITLDYNWGANLPNIQRVGNHTIGNGCATPAPSNPTGNSPNCATTGNRDENWLLLDNTGNIVDAAYFGQELNPCAFAAKTHNIPAFGALPAITITVTLAPFNGSSPVVTASTGTTNTNSITWGYAGPQLTGASSSYQRSPNGGAWANGAVNNATYPFATQPTAQPTNHPTPKASNTSVPFSFSVTGAGSPTIETIAGEAVDVYRMCSATSVTMTYLVNLFQNVQRTTTYNSGKIGSYVSKNSGASLAWTSISPAISAPTGVTTLDFTETPAAGITDYELVWEDFIVNCCGATTKSTVKNTASCAWECYGRKRVRIIVDVPLVSASAACNNSTLGINNVILSPTNATNVTYTLTGGLTPITPITNSSGFFQIQAGNGAVGNYTITVASPCISNIVLSPVACLANPPCPKIDGSQLKFGLSCSSNVSKTTATLAAGDIAFTGYKTTNPDGLSFVLLVDVEQGTTIKFTDNGWLSTPANNTNFRMNEGVETWTAPCLVSAGTIITVPISALTSVSLTATDQIIAYTGLGGTASTTVLAAIGWQGAAWDATAIDANTSANPGGSSIRVAQANAIFNCATLTAGDTTAATLTTRLTNNANWVSSTAITPTCNFTIAKNTCTPCPTDIITLRSSGSWLPSGGYINWYSSETASFTAPSTGIAGTGTNTQNILSQSVTATTVATSTAIVINEIAVAPNMGIGSNNGNQGQGGEFIELFCPTGTVGGCDISGFRIGDGNQFVATIPANTIVAAGSYYVIGGHAVTNVNQVVGDGNNFNLTDAGENVVLFDCSGSQIGGYKWATAAGPNTLSAATNGEIPAVNCAPTLASLTLLAGTPSPATNGIFKLSGATWSLVASTAGTPGAANAGGNGTTTITGTTCNYTPTCTNIDNSYTIPTTACNKTIYFKGVVDGLNGTCANGTNTALATTKEFKINVTCPTAVLSGNVFACSPTSTNITLTASNGLNGYIPNIKVNGAAAIPFPALSGAGPVYQISVATIGTYELSSITPTIGNCSPIASGTAEVKTQNPPIAATQGGCTGAGLDLPTVQIFPTDFVNVMPVNYCLTATTPSMAGLPICNTSGAFVLDAGTTSANYTMETGTSPTNCITNFTQSISACLSLPVILPLYFVEVNCMAIDNQKIEINWIPAFNKNIAYFEVEKSINNGQSFQKITTVMANNQSISNYHYTDLKPANGINHYRIVAVLENTNTVYSSIVFDKISSNQFTPQLLSLIVSPTVVTNSLQASYYFESDKNASIQITNILGQTTMNKSFVPSLGENNIDFDVTKLHKGIYFVIILQNGNHSNTQKIVKQ
jgi:hypothetical protein